MLVEVLGDAATADSYFLFRVCLVENAFLTLDFLCMCPVLAYLVPTVLADSQASASLQARARTSERGRGNRARFRRFELSEAKSAQTLQFVKPVNTVRLPWLVLFL